MQKSFQLQVMFDMCPKCKYQFPVMVREFNTGKLYNFSKFYAVAMVSVVAAQNLQILCKYSSVICSNYGNEVKVTIGVLKHFGTYL